MKIHKMIRSTIISSVLLIASIYAGQVNAQTMSETHENVSTIKLNQAEGVYETTELNLSPGKYIFEVTNKEVDKGLGFWLTTADDPKSQIANSGLENLVKKGETSRTGVVTLSEGTYQYSCPLNPTPHYIITVSK